MAVGFAETVLGAVVNDDGSGTTGTAIDRAQRQNEKRDHDRGIFADYTAAGVDANPPTLEPILGWNTVGLLLGPGGATVLDALLKREAAAVLAARNAADSAYGIMRAADPVGADDLVTKRHYDANLVTDHGALTGLADDDHPQYAKLTGASFTGNVSAAKTLTFDALFGTRIDANLTVNVNDWAPTGWDGNNGCLITLNPDALVDITGLANGANGRVVMISNRGGSVATLKHESASSTSGNRFTLPGSKDLVLAVYDGVILQYQTSNSRWIAVSLARASMFNTPQSGVITISGTATSATAAISSVGSKAWVAYRGRRGSRNDFRDDIQLDLTSPTLVTATRYDNSTATIYVPYTVIDPV